DVTELCRQAAATLGPNEMIHDADFNLYSAMSALELMDAKMDKAPPALQPLESRISSGALATNLDTKLSSAISTTAVSAAIGQSGSPEVAQTAATTVGDTARSRDALSERTLAVLDGMSVCEVAWLEGGSLPETVYACLYFHPTTYSAMLRELGWDPPRLDGGSSTTMNLGIRNGKTLPWKPVVRALTLAVLAQSLATLRCCSMTRDVIILADIFEEEDFYPSTFGFRLSPPVDDDSVIDLIDLATAAMEDRVTTSATINTGCGEDSSSDRTILAYLTARKEWLLGCLALRDALTNKQRQRRLQALAKQRAARDAKRQEEAAVPLEGVSGTESTENRLNDRTCGTEATSASTKSTIELDESDRRVAAAAAGLAALTMCCDKPHGKGSSVGETGPGGGESKARGSDVSGDVGAEGCAGSSQRDTEKSRDGVVGVSAEGAPEAEEGHTENALDLAIEGKKAFETSEGAAEDENPVVECTHTEPKPPPDGSGWAEATAETDGEQAEETVEDIEAPLRGIERCERHVRAAYDAFDSLLEALSARSASSENATEVCRNPTAASRADMHESTAGGAAGSKADDDVGAKKLLMKLGGECGGFAFEAEMNRHLLGSSPHHHVHFRWGKGDGVRALRVLARETATACGVIRCRDLADVRQYLLRFSQPPLE
ncbi:unnamed protein product, partial [Sphacelaria rigidula]